MKRWFGFGFLFLLALFSFLFPCKVLAENLLQNPGFESSIDNWDKYPSTATFTVSSEHKKTGEYGAILTKENAKGMAYFSQRVVVEENKYYQLSGWVLLNHGDINNIKLRFYWLDERESKISTEPVAIEIKLQDSSFQFLQTEPSISPSSARLAEIQGYVFLDQEDVLTPAIFDDLVFLQVPPPTPTPIPTQTPIPTPNPPTNTPTPVPPIPTPTSTPLPSPTLKPTATTAEAEGEVLALSDEEEVEPSPGDEIQEIKDLYQPPEKKKSFLFPAVLIVGGIGLVSFSVYSLLKKEDSEEEDEN